MVVGESTFQSVKQADFRGVQVSAADVLPVVRSAQTDSLVLGYRPRGRDLTTVSRESYSPAVFVSRTPTLAAGATLKK